VNRLGALEAQARILAATTTAALDFHDRQAAQEYVNALGVDPQITAVGLYSLPGGLFAAYRHAGAPTLPATAPAGAGVYRRDGMVGITAPVVQRGARLGTVLLESPEEPLVSRLELDGPIAALLAMAALLVAGVGMAEVALRRANRSLALRAQELTAANEALQQQIAQREQAEAALRQSQKMEAIGQLTGGVAHDFNNLLQIIIGSLERLRMRAERAGGLDANYERLIEAAMQGGRRAAMLTQRLLAFSRRQPLAPKPTDINKLVTGMSDLLTRTLGESIEIEVVLAGGLWGVFVDENQLENALLNLAVNARDAMPAGGKLTIETSNAFLDEAYARAKQEVRPGQYVLLAVTDSGCGMTNDVLTKVFEPFFTTKEIGKGTGLGLSQVYGFIKQSHGHTEIYSEPGQGTTVKIYLPRQLSAAGGGAAPLADANVPVGDAHDCILVVEDEEGVRNLSVAILQDLGYAVLQAADGPAALAVLQQESCVRLLFTDVGLPKGMTGRQLADAAKQLQPELKVLFTTGYARNAIVHDGRLDQGGELITKPFSAAELGRRVRAILDQ
jgi:signal transduction histidine kinase/CheY-like chemotaxis protein